MQAKHRFLLLDAMRGLAAAMVVVHHNSLYFGRQVFPHGYLAVDFFFMLSGFVLTSTYEKKLNAGWSVWAFFKVRLIRLYPLYALGSLTGLMVVLLRHAHGHEAFVPSRLAMQCVLTLFLLPVLPWMGLGLVAFPLDGPAWSLFMEVMANVVHALILRRGVVMLAGALVFSAAGMAWILMHFGTLNVGLWAGEILYVIPRTFFSYTAGIVLYKLWYRYGGGQGPAPGWIGLALLAIPAARFVADSVYDILAVCVMFPVILLAGATFSVSERWEGVAGLLGQVSYAIYILHTPLSDFWSWISNRVGGHSSAGNAPWGGFAILLLVFGAAWVADQIYDIPVREWLRCRLSSSQA